MNAYLPSNLRTFPPQAKVVWLYYRDHPDAAGSGALLHRECGGDPKKLLSSLHALAQAGLLIATDPPPSTRTQRYRVCTADEATQARPFTR